MKLRLPDSYYNTLSYIGTAIAIIATFMFVFLYTIASFSSIDRAYLGIILFLVIPFFILLGLILIPIGMIRRSRKQKKAVWAAESRFPVFDFNQPHQRNAAIVFTIGTTIFLFLSALGSYEAYHFTESVTFCGRLCHSVMEPEYTAYQNSPHARVTCVECHVGTGANWYVKSKLSGLYQVYATVFNKYPRPIPTPIKNLRPARETCEQCHWPQKIYGKQLRREFYFLGDEHNTAWEIDLLMNVGGGNPALKQTTGIHWHINPDIQIEYVVLDEKRLQIPRVILINLATRDTTIYDNENMITDPSALASAPRRVMDCMDCHNRPSHIYEDPNRFINIAMAAGTIPPELAYIKKIAVQTCVEEYPSQAEAFNKIASTIRDFYQYGQNGVNDSLIHRAIEGTQAAFAANIFPTMKVRWSEYPNHIGHMTTVGCFRCHDDEHVSNDGRTISKACEACHLITAQGAVNQMEFAGARGSLEFLHPEDIGDEWRTTLCHECHSTPPL